MAAPFLNVEAGLGAIRDDLVYLKHRLSRDPRAKDLGKLVVGLLTEWDGVHVKQLAHWDAQTLAQVDVVIADEALDTRVDAFDNDLRRAVGGDREDPRYRLYISGGVYELKRPVLGDELETLREWEEHLTSEEDATLTAHREGLSKEIADADAAVKARTAADAKNAAFRATGDYARFVTSVTTTRDHVWATLDGRRAKDPANLPRDWATGFFRPKAPAPLTDAEREARAAARTQARAARLALAQKRKELADKLRETQREIAALGKKPRKAKA